jgi:hypothetical protein
VKCGLVQRPWLVRAGGWLWAVAGSGPSVPPSTARLLALDHNRLHMESQPRHAAAQVTLLEASFVFPPVGGRFLWWGAKIQVASSTVLASSQCCCRMVHATSSSEHNRASSSKHNRASSSGAACSSSGMQRQQSAASAERQDQGAEQDMLALGCLINKYDKDGSETLDVEPIYVITKAQVPSASRSSSSGELQAAAAASGERRAAAATESSLVQARKSGLTKANIDPQPPSTVVLQARAQLRKRSVRKIFGRASASTLVSSRAYGCYFFGRD